MNIDLIKVYVQANLKNQISETYFGWVWWIVEPVLTMLVYYFVFDVMLNRGGAGYVYHLLIGVVVWSWFGDTVIHARTSILQERGVIATTAVDKSVFPIIKVVESLVKQLFVLGALLLFLALTSGFKSTWVYIPVLLIEECLLILSVSVFVAAIVPFLPDLKFVIGILMRAMMFCSGVFFSLAMLPEHIQKYFLLNPMGNIIEQFRQILVYGREPSWESVLGISVVSLLFLFVSIKFVKFNNKVYARLVIQ